MTEEEEEEVKKASTQRRVLESPSGPREETIPDSRGESR